MPAAAEIAVRGTALVYALVEGASVTVGRVAQCETEGAGVHFDLEVAVAVLRLHARGELNVE